MGAIAKGKVNASEVQIGMRIIVNTNGSAYPWVEGTTINPSRTKTGEGVVITTVTAKGKVRGARGYLIETGAGSFYAEPIQTMWLAPEDAPGIKRAHVEALAEDEARTAATPAAQEAAADEQRWANGSIIDAEEQAYAEAEERAAEQAEADYQNVDMTEVEAHKAAVVAEAELEDELARREAELEEQAEKDLTLDSQDCKVDTGSEDEPEGDEMTTETIETEAPVTRELTGSGVVRMLEKVYARIRQNHPELPAVVMVTGSGADAQGQKWGHFRPKGWMTKVADEGVARFLDEMFMAGETLAKGAEQVLQTMLHESTHTLCELRGIKDTSRQGRWHNRNFVKVAEEMGLEYKPTQADKSIGFSAVTLTEATRAEYADLLAELDAEIDLMVKLPAWLSGGGLGGLLGGLGEPEGGEGVRRPRGGEPTTNTTNLKLTCACEEPNIIRASRKVAAKMVVMCEDCNEHFRER